MTQYIDKDALIAEIEKIRAKWFGINNAFADGQKGALTNVLSLIKTFEVKEVDLEKEFDKCCENYIFDDECEVYTARHFFELGLKTQKI